MRYCHTCREWKESIKDCCRLKHSIDWNNGKKKPRKVKTDREKRFEELFL